MNQNQTNPYETGLGGFNAGSSSRIELSVKTNRFNWFNGRELSMSEEYAPQTKLDALVHFGGWYVDNEYLDYESPVPITFEEMTLKSDKGDRFEVHGSRYINCIPLLSRTGWWEKSKSTYQVLVALFDLMKDSGFQFIGYGVLQAKGKGGTEGLQKALNSWPKLTANVRSQNFKNYDPWVFVMPLGTFGNKRIDEIVNKKYSSKAVVCQVLPEGTQITVEGLQKRLIAPEVLSDISTIKETNQEWADDWNNKTYEDWQIIQAKIAGEYVPGSHAGMQQNPNDPMGFVNPDLNSAPPIDDEIPF